MIQVIRLNTVYFKNYLLRGVMDAIIKTDKRRNIEVGPLKIISFQKTASSLNMYVMVNVTEIRIKKIEEITEEEVCLEGVTFDVERRKQELKDMYKAKDHNYVTIIMFDIIEDWDS